MRLESATSELPARNAATAATATTRSTQKKSGLGPGGPSPLGFFGALGGDSDGMIRFLSIHPKAIRPWRCSLLLTGQVSRPNYFAKRPRRDTTRAVSYTHLTLPTIY